MAKKKATRKKAVEANPPAPAPELDIAPDIAGMLERLGIPPTREGIAAAQLQFEKHLCELSFYYFVRKAWLHLPGESQFVDNWHIGALCYHLEALYQRQMTTLLVNISPGCSKSTIASVLFPLWYWIKQPSAGLWMSSYAQKLCKRDADRSKGLLQSDWFKSIWGDLLAIRDDRSELEFYHNHHGGWRLSVTIGSKTGTGFHPDMIGIDDSANPQEVLSPSVAQVARDYWSDTLSTRGILKNVIKWHIAQRLGENDLSAHIIETTPSGLVHLTIPMKFESDNCCRTNIRYADIDDLDENGYPRIKEGWEDPRIHTGVEWMWPQLYTEERYLQATATMRPHQIAGQYQQRPSSPQGDMFVAEMFGQEVDAPPQAGRAVRAWDKASSTGKKADYTVGVLMVFDGQFYYVVDVKRFKMERKARDAEIAAAAQSDQELYGHYEIRFEREGASAGKDAADMQAEELSLYFKVRIDRAHGKPKGFHDPLKGWDRWHELLSRGLVKFVKGPWLKALKHEHLAAPLGRHDDIIDACALAARVLSAGRNYQRIKRPLLVVTEEEQAEMAEQTGKRLCDVCVGLGCGSCGGTGFTSTKGELESLIPPVPDEDDDGLALLSGGRW